jgi:hypothetical protein
MSEIVSVRGIRNNNPGNIRIGGDKWQGLSAVQDDGAFFKFETARMGIRALARILITYQDKYGLASVAKIIARWAPPEDNNPTIGYASFVARHAGVGINDPLDLHDYEDLIGVVEGIILFENGLKTLPYDAETMDAAMKLAGVEPPVKPLSKSREIKGAQVASAGVLGTGLASVADNLKDVAGQVQPLMGYAAELKWLFIGLTLAGILVTVYARIRAHNEGAR